MKTTTFSAISKQDLLSALKNPTFEDNEKLLVQLFDGRNSYDDFVEISAELHNIFPKAVIIGATTAGEIVNGKMLDGHMVVSLSIFERTNLIPLLADECDTKAGLNIGATLNMRDVKAAILFSEGLSGRPEQFISAISEMAPDLTISGGAAADNYNFKQTGISLNGIAYTKGVVGVAFENIKLLVKNSWRLNWKPIGKHMQITKAIGNTVYEIDSRPILEVIEQYFGQKVLKNLPSSIVGFPLIKSDEGIHIARAPVGVRGDALVFAGELHNGDIVRFGIADMASIGVDNYEHYSFKPDAIWLYSCAGRKSFAKNELEKEFACYRRLASTAGFFTYGEFFKAQNSINMLNLTTSVLAIAEDYTPVSNIADYEKEEDVKHSDISTIAHLTNSTVKELEQTVKTLDSYKIALDSNSIVSKTNKKGIITYVNELFVRVSGYSKEELIGKSHNIIRHPDMASSIFKEMWMTISSGATWKGIVKNRAKSGKAYYVDTSIVPLLDENGEIVEYIAARTDLTKIIEQQKTIEKQSTDDLTGLPNRVKFFEDLESTDNPVAALINIDEFGNVNRFYGFETGNQVLSELAKKLIDFCTQKGYSVYKFDADNFLVFGINLEINSFVLDMEVLNSELRLNGFLPNSLDIKLRFTTGIATSKKQLLSKAEEALKKARIKHANIAILNEEDEKNKRQNFEMLQLLEYAINNDGITPYYQPIVDLATSQIIKYESLMRLIDKNGKVYSPFLFLDIAKKSKYYLALTSTIIKKTLKDFEHRKESVSINLSMIDIENEDSVKRIKEAVLSFSDPDRITFEITESETSEDYEKIISFIDDIKSSGVRISIDDFGSGYSNFAYLTRFHADFLKIDGSIIKNIATDIDSYKMVSVIVDLANKLGMKTVAEFISSEDIESKVKELNVNLGQGYLYSEPKPIDEL